MTDNHLQQLREQIEAITDQFTEPGTKYLRDLNGQILALFTSTIEAEVVSELEAIKTASQKSYDDSGKGSRPQWSKQNETKGESYSRTQGFKSAMLVTMRKLDNRIAALQATQQQEEKK